MKAAVFKEPGKPLSIEKVKDTICGVCNEKNYTMWISYQG